jgi:hypothetical protein
MICYLILGLASSEDGEPRARRLSQVDFVGLDWSRERDMSANMRHNASRMNQAATHCILLDYPQRPI